MTNYAEKSGSMPAVKSAIPLADFVFFGFLLVVLNVVFDPRAVDVTLIPRLLALLVFLALFLGYLALNPRRRSFAAAAEAAHDPLIIAYAFYALLTSLSLLSAYNVTAGWTDVFRTWAAFIVLVLTCALLSGNPGWPALLAKLAIVAGLVSAAVGYHELSTKLGFGVHERDAMLGVTGLMSNVNLYASFLNLVLPLCLCGVVILHGWWRILGATVALMLLLMILLLQSRGAYVALAGGLVVAAGLVFVHWRRLGLGSSIRVALVLLSLVAFAAAAVFVATAEANQIAERVRSIAHGDPATAAGGRLVIWGLTLQMTADHWLTGIGAGNFPVVLHDYFDIDNPDFSPIHPNWLQPHNDFLWVLAEKGVPGFIAFVAIFVFAALNLRSAIRQSVSPAMAWTAVFTALALSTYLIGSFFDFPQERINHQVYLSVYLGMSVILGRGTRFVRRESAVIDAPSRRMVAAFVAAAVILAAGLWYSAAALRQEWYVIRARINLAEDDHESMVGNARRASTFWKNLDHFATPVAFLEGLGLMFLAKHDEALICFERAKAQIPSRIYITKHLGLLAALRKDYARAIKAFSAALERSPENVDTITRLAMCYAETGDPARALDMLQKIPPGQVDEQVERAFARVRRIISDSKDESSSSTQNQNKR